MFPRRLLGSLYVMHLPKKSKSPCKPCCFWDFLHLLSGPILTPACVRNRHTVYIVAFLAKHGVHS